MGKRALIIGDHPIAADIVRQYEAKGIGVERIESIGTPTSDEHDEIVILTAPAAGNRAIEVDTEAMQMLTRLAAQTARSEKSSRPKVHLLLQSPTTLRMLQAMDFPAAVNEAFEVYPFTLEDAWAKRVLVSIPGRKKHPYPPLDREPIGSDSQQRVHLVISGMNEQAEALALHAALICHYPNYRSTDKRPVRTRITIIDNSSDATKKREDFIARQQQLFDNSFYRIVNIANETTETHRPQFYGRRADFVDIEWELVEGSLSSPSVKNRLSQWATDSTRQLSIALCHDSDETNLIECMALPPEIADRNITVYLRLKDENTAEPLTREHRNSHIYPFGMTGIGYDITQPLMAMAKMVHYFYETLGDGMPTELPQERVDAHWTKAVSLKHRLSSMHNIMSISSKMHSLGHNPDEADTYYALTAEEIERLAATEHNRWNVDRLITGSRPCSDAERDAIIADRTLKAMYKNQRDTHFDLCAFEELRHNEKGVDIRLYDYQLTACIPLIVESFATNR